MTSQRIREAFSPPGSPEPGHSYHENGNGLGELSSDSEEDDNKDNADDVANENNSAVTTH